RGYDMPNKIYREKLLKRPELRHKRVLNAAGSLVPTRRPANTLVWHNFIGIGDNAYTVNPIHGGGMGYAMFAALQAAKAIDEALEKDSFTATDLWNANLGYMRTLGAKQASLDIFRMFLQVTSNDDIELGLSKGLMRETEMYETSVTGELKVDMSKLQMLKTALSMMSRPTLLLKLSTVRTYMKKVKELYSIYPDKPEGLPRWVSQIEKLYAEYKSSIGYKD
ncbi:MAG: dehydrogenase, partial [Desulfurococcales archaeon]|nr:dehydrogenase [Desulfurococcales archaeon]